ncbi:MAG: hypothetical protein AB8F34_11170 [Akkermansiaceae bacterium]
MLIASFDWETFLPIAFALGGILVFISFWCFVCWIISSFGGWGRMAKRFPRTNLPTGKRFSMTSGSVGLANYNNCLTIHVNEHGIDFAVWPIFAVGHKPVFIPWADLNNPQIKRFLWHKYARIDVGSPKVATITVTEEVFGTFKDLMAHSMPTG